MLAQGLSVFIGIVVIALIVFAFSKNQKKLKTKAWVINLAKNKDRLDKFSYFYTTSDLNDRVPLDRFDAIYGKELDIQKYITPTAYSVLLQNEKNKYRTKHYQLTRGAVGCYLSHMALFEKLLEDPSVEYYLIFEDDAIVMSTVYNRILKALNTAPSNWDMIVLSPIMEVSKKKGRLFNKFETFWGLTGYIVNKKGAKKLVDEFKSRPISMQIDSKMSLMIMQGKLHVYGYKEKVLWHNKTSGTDIQMPVIKQPGINEYLIEDL